MRFTFEVAGKKEMDRAFNRVTEHISDLRPLWPEVTRTVFNIEEEQFKSQGAKGRSGKWEKLSRNYAKQKERDYPGKPILQRTGRLEAALTSKTGDTVLIEEKQEYGFGTSLFYAAFHQAGTNKMPSRPPINFSEDNRRDITKAMQKGLLSIIKKDRQVTQSLEIQD